MAIVPLLTNAGRYYGAINAGLTMTKDSLSSASANRTALNSAINAAKVSGKPYVYVPSGRWYYAGSVYVDSVILYGEADTVLVGNDGTSEPNCTVVLAGQCPGLKWLTIEIQGATTKGGPHGVSMYGARGGVAEGVTVIRPNDMAFIIEAGSKNCRIHDCKALNPLADAYHIQASSNCQVSSCYAEQAGDDFFAATSEQSDAYPMRNALYMDCTARDHGTNTPKPTGRGCLASGGNDIVFRRMTIDGVTSHGMSVRQATPYYYDSPTDNVLFDTVSVSNMGHGLDWNGVRPYYGIYIDCDDPAFPISNVRAVNCTVSGGGYTAKTFIDKNGQGTSNIDLSGVT